MNALTPSSRWMSAGWMASYPRDVPRMSHSYADGAGSAASLGRTAVLRSMRASIPLMAE